MVDCYRMVHVLPQHGINSVLHYLSLGWAVYGAVGIEVHLAACVRSRIVSLVVRLGDGVKVGGGSIVRPGVSAGVVAGGTQLEISRKTEENIWDN